MKKFKVKNKAKPIPKEELLVVEKPPEKVGRSRNTLPSDEYKPIFEPLEQQVSKSSKIVMSVKRVEPFGLIHVFLETYQETQLSKGLVPRKRVDFPLEYLLDVVELLQQINDTCEDVGLNKEVEELLEF